jgi:hypothetical protein
VTIKPLRFPLFTVKVFGLLLTIAGTMLSFPGKSQPAIIKDKDGFSNVRAGSSIGSKINDTLKSERVVYFFEEGTENNWAYIDYNKGEDQKTGYVHRSRIRLLDSLRLFKQSIPREGIIKLYLDSFLFSITTMKFIPTGRRITRNRAGEGATYISEIDGKKPWGTDGNMPRKEYRSILFINGRDSIALPQKEFQNLFEPTDNTMFAFHDPETGKLYLECNNGDGAGGYVVVWVFNKKGLIGREIFIPF